MESSREPNEAVVARDDVEGAAEVAADLSRDPLAPYFAGQVAPRVMVTTAWWPSARLNKTALAFCKMIPGARLHRRGTYTLAMVVEAAKVRIMP